MVPPVNGSCTYCTRVSTIECFQPYISRVCVQATTQAMLCVISVVQSSRRICNTLKGIIECISNPRQPLNSHKICCIPPCPLFLSLYGSTCRPYYPHPAKNSYTTMKFISATSHLFGMPNSPIWPSE